METTRIYKGKDSEMLIVLSVIVGFCLQNISFLSTKRSNWNKAFFDSLQASIDALVKKHMGYDSALAMRNATNTLKGIMKPAYKALSEFKVQIEEDFKKDKTFLNELLISLGFRDHFAALNSGDQEAMIQHLYMFATNITPAQKTAIIAKGMMPQLITDILGYADNLIKANILQEQLKGARPETSANRVTDLNDLYNTVISVAKMAHRFCKGNPALQDHFSYTKGLKNLNHSTDPKDPPQPPNS